MMSASAELVDQPQGDPELSRLLVAASGGDEEAWRRIIDLYARRVFALCRSRCGRHDVAEEITQSVFATVAVKLTSGEYTEQGRFESWLFRVAMNRVRDEIRRVQRHAEPTDPEVLKRVARASDQAESELPEQLSVLREAMHTLSDSDREIVELRHHAGLTFRQIAEILSEPMGTLLARHHRALRKLRSMLLESGSFGEVAE